MIQSYLGLVIIIAVQHQVTSLTDDAQQKVPHKIDKMKIIEGIQKRIEMTQDPIDNYDLIVTDPSDTMTIKPVLRHHHHHRQRSGKDTKVSVKNDNPFTPQAVNTLRGSTDITGITKKPMHEDRDAMIANNLKDKQKGSEKEVATQSQKERYTTTTDKHDTNLSGEEKSSTTQTKEDKRLPRQRSGKRNRNVTPVVPFYRRVNYLSDQERKKPQKWVHCLDLVGPRLKGYKDPWFPIEITNRHTDIKRLAELLITDVSQYTEEEIVSVLYQISGINLRLYQWDYLAITLIMNVIITGPIHDFRTLKSGVKYLFDKWHLDTSMLRTFLEQTRIFRPPCVDISGMSGFTKKAGGNILYTKPDKSTRKHRGDESCHSREIPVNNNN